MRQVPPDRPCTCQGCAAGQGSVYEPPRPHSSPVKELDRILLWVIGIFLAACLVALGIGYLPALAASGPVEVSAAQAGCLASGGTVGEHLCCLSVTDFPDRCMIGSCACSAEDSHSIRICNCPAGSCFNGTACVSTVRTFAECVAAGYTVTGGNPRQCSVPGGPSFTEPAPPALTADSCGAARGHWTDCGSRCRIDNQGKTGIACPDLCESLCECGGIAGFGCPDGYSCRTPSGIADALGYCVAKS